MDENEFFRREYERALEYLNRKKPELHPSERRSIARRIAEKKCRKYDLHRKSNFEEEFSLSDLAIP